ncbi:MAG: xylulokinase [Actinomycetes bacterium]
MTLGEEVTIGLDLGTSGLKAVARGVHGRVVARAQAGYPTARPEPGASQQDPADWLTAIRAVASELAGTVPVRRWAGIGLSAMIPTLVTTDATGAPVGAAVTWEDARADEHGEALRRLLGPEELYRRTGQWVDGRYLLPMLIRLAGSDPDRVRSTAAVLGAKDYLYGWLTGEEPVTDPSTATGFGCYDLVAGQWLGDVLAATTDLLGQPVPALPEVRDSGHVGRLCPQAAGALGLPRGVPVVLGAADSVLGALGLGVRTPGEVAYVAGTSTVVLAVTDAPTPDPEHRYLLTPLAGTQGWGVEMDLLATGSSFRWLAELFGCDEAAVAGLGAIGLERDPRRAPCFLPYLAPGEQGALWDPSLTGRILGLTLHHDRADLAAALLTGIVLESRRCLHLAARATGRTGPVRVAGAGATSTAFRRALADASGREVLVTDPSADHSALGAAMLAAQALGVPGAVRSGPSAGADVPDEVPYEVVVPDPAATDAWSRRSERHERELSTLRCDRGTGASLHQRAAGRLRGGGPDQRGRPVRWRGLGGADR